MCQSEEIVSSSQTCSSKHVHPTKTTPTRFHVGFHILDPDSKMLVETPSQDPSTTSPGLKVLITGFAVRDRSTIWQTPYLHPTLKPFYTPPQPNPSSALLPLLPSHIPASPTHASITLKTLDPVRVSYSSVLSLVPSLTQYDSSAESTGAPDIIIHIGMSLPRSGYHLETVAHRDGYVKPDVDRKVLTNGVVGEWVKESRPEVLSINLRKANKDDVWRRWKSWVLATGTGKSKGDRDVDIVLSENAGRYLCEFILYASLSFWAGRGKGVKKKGKEKDGKQSPVVVFLHVPAECTMEDLERGKRMVVALVKALAESCFGKVG
jgi:hypothetical protein